MNQSKITLPSFFILIVSLFTSLQLKAEETSSDAASKDWTLGNGKALILRHALAPGTGDPANFKLGDCSTQRNLNESGRKQARDIGDWLRHNGIQQASVYTSQWCRCVETAELLGFGPVTELPALNSFFQRRQDKASNLKALRNFLTEQSGKEELIILVTHQVTITALTDVFPASGIGVILKLNQQNGFEVGPQIGFQ